MGLNIKREQNRLEQMSIVELRERYHGLSSRRVSIKCKRWFIKRILWLMQAASEGDISEESRLLSRQIAASRPLRKSMLEVLPEELEHRLGKCCSCVKQETCRAVPVVRHRPHSYW